MEKAQNKIKKDKKKNTQTGLLMGQNTNIFSQLSAVYLQNKTDITQQQNQFLKSTPILQYHDPNINRILGLLRKKADVTKGKAAIELRQQVLKMDTDGIQQFVPILSQLYMQITINQQSKQVIDQFTTIIINLLQRQKKILLKQITTLYGPMLINAKLNLQFKLINLLFNGTEKQQNQKSLRLFLKKQVRRKFMILCKIILQCQQQHKIGQINYQRNCTALMKIMKDFIKIQNDVQIQGQDWLQFLIDVDQILISKSIESYLNVGGKSKAAILQLYTTLLQLYSKDNSLKISWEYFAQTIGQNYLEKDMLVQQTMWKYCNCSYLDSLKRISQQNNLLNKYIPKYQQKFIQVLKVGGLQMYKILKNYLQIFPQVQFQQNQQHKNIINKINYIKKIFITLLGLQDQHQARLQCYYQIAMLIIAKIRLLLSNDLENKKAKQINSLVNKLERQIIQNLQSRYYDDPPVSKNSFSYYIPKVFTKLIQNLNIKYQFKFHPIHTFTLYNDLQFTIQTSYLFDLIYGQCINEDLKLLYLINFPKRNVIVDLSENNKFIENTCKIFLLSQQSENQQWFQPNWDQKKKIIIYDPRITQKQLNDQLQQDNISISYKPIKRFNNQQSSLFQNPINDQKKVKYFFICLNNPQYIHCIKYLLPFIIDYLFKRTTPIKNQTIIELIQIFVKSATKLENNEWQVSIHQVTKIRLLCQLIFQAIKNGSIPQNSPLDIFYANFCEFARRIYNYRMEKQAESILQKSNIIITICYEQLLQSLHRCLIKSLDMLESSTLKQQKTRKIRLNKFISFFQLTLNYLTQNNFLSENLILIFQVLERDGWKYGSNRIDLWYVGKCILSRMSIMSICKLANYLLQNNKKYSNPIGLIMCAQIILPLQMHSNIKSVYITLQQQLLNSLSKLQQKKQLEFCKNILDCSINIDLYTIFGVKTIIKFIMKSYTNISKQILNQYLNLCLQKQIKQIQQSNNNIQKISKLYYIIQNILPQLPLKDIQISNNIYNNLSQLIINHQNLSFLCYCGIITLFWENGISIQTFNQNNKDKFISIIDKLFKNIDILKNQKQYRNFCKNIIFCFANSSYQFCGILPWKNYLNKLIELFQQEIIKGTFMHGIAQSNRIKFISRFFKDLEPQYIANIAIILPKQCLNEYYFYRNILQLMEDQSEQNQNQVALRHEHIINIFIQFSQVFMRIMLVLNSKCKPQEQILLQLLQCPFAGLKKTVFILLKQMYDQRLVDKQPPKIFLKFLSKKIKVQKQQISPLTASILSSFFYYWEAIILRRQSIQQNRSQQQQSITLQDYLQNNSLYQQFLKLSFQILQNNIDYLKRQPDYQIQPDQLRSMDLIGIGIDDDNNLNRKLFKLIVKSLFIFILNFPMFLRNFIDSNRKYRNLSQRLLRNIISDAIFNQQVIRIQLKQSQWKSNGNFQIYVNAKNRQIYAQYTHDVIRIGLRLIMKAAYPLIPIIIEFGQGLKLEEGGKWQLMLQTQLHNKNNTIINGILLWKVNIDKKLAGTEQCSICFDIVNSTGQLPKKACKTCRKRFHGNCIMKWFTKSNKSECPLCKSQFL